MSAICGLIAGKALNLAPEDLGRAMLVSLGNGERTESDLWAQEEACLGYYSSSGVTLSASNRLPATSASGRWTLTLSGEIYNFNELKAYLLANTANFRSRPDNQLLVTLIEDFGFKAIVSELRGKFALAAWDEEEKMLYLGRDQSGQASLFYGLFAGNLVFTTELKALKALPWQPSIDIESVAQMLRYNSIPAPRSIYQGLHKLPPASFASYSLRSGLLSPPVSYWQPRTARRQISFSGALLHCKEQLQKAVADCLPKEGAVGVFLSGGIDSSLVAAFASTLVKDPLCAFTIDFEDAGFSEAAQARAVASRLGIEHRELLVTRREVLDLLPALAAACNEPFGDSSLVPTLLVSKLASDSMAVVLSGDGGDEVFGGYHRQIWLPLISRLLSLTPLVLRRQLAVLFKRSELRSLILGLVSTLRLPIRMADDKYDKLVMLLQESSSLECLYRSSLSQNQMPLSFLSAGARDQLLVAGGFGAAQEFLNVDKKLSLYHKVCLADYLFYLPTDGTVKTERASSYYNLDVRAPFLDPRLIDFTLGLDRSLKVEGCKGKILLRHMLAQFLPTQLIDLPKMGFAFPLASFLRSELRPWAEDLLSASNIAASGILDPAAAQSLWKQHMQGIDRHHQLWNILMLLTWLGR